MGRRMSSALLSRACALALAFMVGILALAALIPAANAVPSPNPIQPAAVTVTVVLDKSSYLSGDTATAQAIVYRTPAPGDYTYVWRVRNFFFQLLNTTTTAGATFRYPIALDYIGTLRFEATVDDGQGTVAADQQSATVDQAYMALSLDRGDSNPGDAISAFYGVTSHVITNPSYAYEVDDTNAVIVLSGTTSATFFSFRTPNPSSRSYTFHVTATDRGNSTQAQATISQAAGFVLGLSFDKPSYAAGDTVHARLTLTARGTASLPSQFRWALSSASASVRSAARRRSRPRRPKGRSPRRPPRRCRSPVAAAANRSTCRRAAVRSRSCAPRAARPRSSRDRRNVHRRATAFPAALGGPAMGGGADLLNAAQKNDLTKAQEILDRHPPLLRIQTPNRTLVLTATFYWAADA